MPTCNLRSLFAPLLLTLSHALRDGLFTRGWAGRRKAESRKLIQGSHRRVT